MPSVPFSYAQAAKGLSTTSSSAPSNVPSEPTTSPKALATENFIPSEEPSNTPWADDIEVKGLREEMPSPLEPSLQSSGLLERLDESEHTNGIADPLSPEPSLSTSSTFVKDDDNSSVNNASSESTWENKSTTSQSGAKPNDRADVQGKKGKRREKDSSKSNKDSKDAKDQTEEPQAPPAAPLHEAPIPSVNIWKQRAEEAKVKFSGPVKSTADSSTAAARSASPSNRSTPVSNNASAAKDTHSVTSKKEKTAAAGSGQKTGSHAGAQDKPGRSSSVPTVNGSIAHQPLPRVGDQELWPTPEIAKDDERKKAQEKADKGDKDRPSAPRPHGRNEWKPVDYTPSVVFNTPVPLLNARRGGRGGGRGGKENSSRAAAAGGGSRSHDKDDGSQSTAANGEFTKRESSKGKRASSADAHASSHAAERSSSNALGILTEKDSQIQESGASTRQSSGSQYNTFPRGGPGAKQRQNKKTDLSVLAEKRTASGFPSPLKSSSTVQSEQNSIASPIGADVDRSIDSFIESQSSSRASPNDRRSSASVALSKSDRAENRARGGIRGGRNVSQPSQHAHNQSRNVRTAGSRAQSIPSDQVYGRYYNGFGPPPAGLAPLQTFIPGMYDQLPVQPMSAVPYNRYVDTNSLIDMVTMQLDYYFSLDNLIKDTWLRKHMDSKGYVFLAVIANFNRLKHLTTDLELIKLCCYRSSKIEYRIGKDGIDRVRCRDGWEKWVLSVSERVPASQNEAPVELMTPPPPRPQVLEPYGMPFPVAPMTAGPEQTAQFSPFHSPNPNGMSAHRASFPNSNNGPVNGTSFPMPSRSPNGENVNGASPQPSTAQNNSEGDDFNDEQIKFLTVIVRKQELDGQQLPPPLAESRTFSNGSLDALSLKDDSPSSSNSTGAQANGVKPVRESAAPGPEKEGLTSRTQEAAKSAMDVFWVKEKDTPVDILPQNAANESYLELRSKALFQRQNAPSGSCPYDMDVLYQFWSHFLIRNFNTHMYDEFRHIAFEDNRERASDIGVKNLLKYYDQALNNDRTIRERIARHYVELVKAESIDHERPGYRQLRTSWRNGALNMRNRKRITMHVDADLKAALES